MADLAQLLQSQDLDALGRSMPEVTAQDRLSRTLPLPDAYTNPYRRAAEAPFRELQWAMMYPLRVWERWDRQQTLSGAPPAFPVSRADGTRHSVHAIGQRQIDLNSPAFQEIARMGPDYVPGERESTNIEDRRPTSIWQYR